ncbi:MAG: 2-phospho-L-lactate guanylyltransferase [Solirubrobacterales bacterium]|nr:MAG: 2-phospho-L-lactate guanylyltransferase [Solirubrobacterales bacterium]
MRTVAVLPVKRFNHAKQRLAQSGLSAAWRRALAEAMVTDVLTALRRAASVDETIVVTAEPIARQLAEARQVSVVIDRVEGGQSSAAQLGIERALAEGAERVLLVPGDCPMLDPRDIDALLGPDHPGVTIVPDRHGTGTNALVLLPPDALAPAFGRDSLSRHRAHAQDAAVPVQVQPIPTLGLDIDTADDLAELEAGLAERRGGAAYTRGMLAQLTRQAIAGAA